MSENRRQCIETGRESDRRARGTRPGCSAGALFCFPCRSLFARSSLCCFFPRLLFPRTCLSFCWSFCRLCASAGRGTPGTAGFPCRLASTPRGSSFPRFCFRLLLCFPLCGFTLHFRAGRAFSFSCGCALCFLCSGHMQLQTGK